MGKNKNLNTFNFLTENYDMKKIAVFASGNGSNAQKIIEYFKEKKSGEVSIIFSNKKDAFVLDRAKNLGVPACVFSRQQFYESKKVLNILLEKETDLIVLAGFLWLIPNNILDEYKNRIINIHPALLPKYGGKGMYGKIVHEAVIDAGDKESGISIHYVNEEYDKGEIIFQAKCPVEKGETPESLARKIHKLEYEYFPKIVENVLNKI